MPIDDDNKSFVALTTEPCRIEGSVSQHHPYRGYVKTPEFTAQGIQMEVCWTVIPHPDKENETVFRVFFTPQEILLFNKESFTPQYPGRSEYYDPSIPEVQI